MTKGKERRKKPTQDASCFYRPTKLFLALLFCYRCHRRRPYSAARAHGNASRLIGHIEKHNNNHHFTIQLFLDLTDLDGGCWLIR